MDNSTQIIQIIANIGIITFVVAGMSALGLELTLKKVIEPLSDLFLLIKVVDVSRANDYGRFAWQERPW